MPYSHRLHLDLGKQGKLRMRGTLVYPRGKYLTLQPSRKDLLCDEALDNIILFS